MAQSPAQETASAHLKGREIDLSSSILSAAPSSLDRYGYAFARVIAGMPMSSTVVRAMCIYIRLTFRYSKMTVDHIALEWVRSLRYVDKHNY